MMFVVTLCLPEPVTSVATSMLRHLSQNLDFCVHFLWLRREGAHPDLYLLFQRYGVPPKMIVDDSKDQTLGVFKRKVLEAGIHLKQTKLESPWKMAAERGTHELKRGSDRIMTKMKSPKVLWMDCLELESYI